MTMPPLEDAMPPQWIVWASNVPPTPQLAEVARRCLCFNPFSVTALLEDLVTVWKRHDGKGCDANASSGEVRSLLQRRYIESLRVAELPPIDDAIADRIMVVAMNFAIDGNTYKATGDRLIHAFIESRLDTSALASIPNNQPPYAENAKEATAEATIKEITEPALSDTLGCFEPSVSCEATFVLVLWTIYAELWKASPTPAAPRAVL